MSNLDRGEFQAMARRIGTARGWPESLTDELVDRMDDAGWDPDEWNELARWMRSQPVPGADKTAALLDNIAQRIEGGDPGGALQLAYGFARGVAADVGAIGGTIADAATGAREAASAARRRPLLLAAIVGGVLWLSR